MLATALLAAALTADPVVPRVQMLCVQAAWCGPCIAADADFRPWLIKSSWRVDGKANAHFRLVDYDESPEVLKQFKVKALPTFILLVDGKEVERWEGYPGRRVLVQRYLEEAKK